MARPPFLDKELLDKCMSAIAECGTDAIRAFLKGEPSLCAFLEKTTEDAFGTIYEQGAIKDETAARITGHVIRTACAKAFLLAREVYRDLSVQALEKSCDLPSPDDYSGESIL